MANGELLPTRSSGKGIIFPPNESSERSERVNYVKIVFVLFLMITQPFTRQKLTFLDLI